MKETLKDKIAIEFMKSVLSSEDRMLDYVEEENIMESIAKDAYTMAEIMIKHSEHVKS